MSDDGRPQPPAAKKKRAGDELTQMTIREEEADEMEGAEPGAWQRADEDTIKQRKIVRVRRGGAATAPAETTEAAPAAAANPFASIALTKPAAAAAPATATKPAAIAGTTTESAAAAFTASAPAAGADAEAATAASTSAAPAASTGTSEPEQARTKEAKPAAAGDGTKSAAAAGGFSMFGAGDASNPAAAGFSGFASFGGGEAAGTAGGGFGALKGAGFGGFATQVAPSTRFGLPAFGTTDAAAGKAAAYPSFVPSAGGGFAFGRSAAEAGDNGNADGEGGEDAEPVGVFAEPPPVVQLEEVEQDNGERDETTLLQSEDARLYEFNAALEKWRGRGTGVLRVKENPSTGTARLVMRDKKTLKLLLNANITPQMTVKLEEKSVKFMCRNAAKPKEESKVDATAQPAATAEAAGEGAAAQPAEQSIWPPVGNYAVRTKTDDDAHKFFDVALSKGATKQKQ